MAFFSTALVIVVLVGLLNYVVDPYDLLGRNRLGVYVAADRESRPAVVNRFSHDAALMGTSKAAMVDTGQLAGFKFLSATFGGATVEELYFFALNYLMDLRLVVLALDFSMFATDPPYIERDPFERRSATSYANYLLSFGTAEDSIQTISRFLRGKPKAFREDGSYITEKWFETKDVVNPAVLENAFDEEREMYMKMHFSEQRMSKLKELRDLFLERGIPVAVVINPLHQRSVEILNASHMAGQQTEWKRRISDLFPLTVDLSDSKYSAPSNFFASDPVHYKPAVGVEFMNTDVLPKVRGLSTKIRQGIGQTIPCEVPPTRQPPPFRP